VDYLIFAKLMTPEEQHLIGPLEPVAYGFNGGCDIGPPWPVSMTKELDTLARAKKPRGH
jgi:hypothetical protein